MQKCKIEIKAENKSKYADWLYKALNGKIAEIEQESGNLYKVRFNEKDAPVDFWGNVRQTQWGIFKNDVVLM